MRRAPGRDGDATTSAPAPYWSRIAAVSLSAAMMIRALVNSEQALAVAEGEPLQPWNASDWSSSQDGTLGLF
jgi:hypothetical protein